MHKVLCFILFFWICNAARAETRLGMVENSYPSFSPDGRRVLFQSNRSGNWELYTMNVDGTGIVQLTSNPASDVTAAFSRDGKSIVFVSDREGNEEIFVIDADGKNPRNVTRNPGGDSHPAWSYDGKRIVFCSTRGDGENDDIYSMNSDGTDVRRLTDNGLYWDTFPSYSPDGTRIAFRRLLRIRTEEGTGVNSEIFVMNSDGSGAVNLSKSGHFDGWPAWSPDGTKIAFSSNRDDVYQIYIMNADGSEQRRVIQSFLTDVRPQWSPDGTRIVFNREYQGTADIVIEPVHADLFVPVVSENIVIDGGSSRGVAWSDFDGDGYADLVVANTMDQNEFVYRNNKNGTFTTISNDSVVTSAGSTEGVLWIDYDNDGDPDLLTTNLEQQGNRLFRNDGDGRFAETQAGDLTVDRLNSSVACSSDFDRDGFLDIFIVNRDEQPDALYRNDSRGKFTRVPDDAIAKNGGEGRACAWGDADGDGYDDLYVGNFRNQRNYFYRNRGNGSFQEITAGEFVSDIASTYGVSWIDFDYDDDLDLMVTNIGRRDRNILYENRGGLQFHRAYDAALSGNPQRPSKGHTWGDFDNDADLELFVANGTEGSPHVQNMLFLRNGTAFERVTQGVLVNKPGISAGTATADYDRDGDLDLFVANWGGDSENNELYRNTTYARNWIVFRLQGVKSNRQAIGARLRITSLVQGQPRRQTRFVTSTTGYGSQNSLDVHFGLLDSNVVETVEIVWPSGIKQTYENVRANRYYIAKEGEETLQPG